MGWSVSLSEPLTYDYDPLGGLGILQNVMIDAHFSERTRQGRLFRLLVHTNTVGVDEDTAPDSVSVYQGGDLDCWVLGSRGVWVLVTPFLLSRHCRLLELGAVRAW